MNTFRRFTFVSIIAALFACMPGLAAAVQPGTIHDVTMKEGNSGTTNMVFTVDIPGEQKVNATANYTTVDGTAFAGTDYVATSGTLTIPAGQLSTTIIAPIIGNTTPGPTRTFTVKLSGSHNMTIAHGHGEAIGTIVDDDGPTLSIGDVAMAEGSVGNCEFTTWMHFPVVLSAATTNDVDFNYTFTQDITGAYPAKTGNSNCQTPDADYARSGTEPQGHIIIPAGQTSAQISVAIQSDITPEFDETFFVDLSAINYANPIKTRGVGTILNDDGLAIAVNDVSTTEGNSGTKNLAFTVSLNQPSAVPVSVHYATANGTALNASDYITKTGTLTIPAGHTSGIVNVQIKGDIHPEPDEVFYLNLSNPSSGVLYKAQGKGTIVNDDGLNISIVPSLVIGEGSNGVFTVTQSAVSTCCDTTFHYATSNGTAIAGTDYTAISGTGTIPAGALSTPPIVLSTTTDKIAEPNKTFFVTLSNPVNAAIDVKKSTITIGNNDGPTLTLGPASAPEGNSGTSLMSFPLTLNGAQAGDVHVAYFTVDGEQIIPNTNYNYCRSGSSIAYAGLDYVATSGTATIPVGHLSTTIDIPIIGNTTPQGNRSFCVVLAEYADYAVVDSNSWNYGALGTINDDDHTPGPHARAAEGRKQR
ncbi:MAG TPA: Calx-beta domain-containing protein [Xanthomonadaceae bacterium]|jgi:chitinase